MSDTRPRTEHETELRSSDQTGSVVTEIVAIARTVDPIGRAGTLDLGTKCHGRSSSVLHAHS